MSNDQKGRFVKNEGTISAGNKAGYGHSEMISPIEPRMNPSYLSKYQLPSDRCMDQRAEHELGSFCRLDWFAWVCRKREEMRGQRIILEICW